ncbi:MAG: response regulator transcription factor [Gammaproteobacteria bacterium]|jgi:DNA-binding response OmpR family regulator
MTIEQLTRTNQAVLGSSPDVLIVESNPHVSGVVELLLKHENYQTRTIRDGQAAIQYINYRNPTSLVILDVDLPYIDGYNVIKKINANKKWHNVPVVFLSSKATEDDIVRCFKLGASDYILKPFLPSELVARINRLVRQAA